MYSRRRGMESQIFCHAQAIIFRAITIWALARFVLAAGWIDNCNYSCIGVLPLALSRALWVIHERKCLWYVRHDQIIPCNTLLKSSPLNIQYIRFALNQCIYGYHRLLRAARGKQLAPRSLSDSALRPSSDRSA
jgi:hypothetical protein